MSEVVAAYRRDGFVLIPGMLPPDVLDELTGALPKILAQESPRRVMDGDTVRSVYGPHQTDPVVNRICRRPDLVGAAMELLGEQVYIHQSKIDVGDHWDWRRDFSSWQLQDGIREPDLVSVAVFLDDMTEGKAPFTFITTESGDAVSPHGPAGSVLFFHPNILYMSSGVGPRTLVVVYNGVSNPPTNAENPRPEFLAARSAMPVVMSSTGSRRAAYARRLATASLDRGDPTGWFEELYAAARRGETKVPWADLAPNKYLVSWAAQRSGVGKRALVVGCGLGDDAEFLSGLGFDVVAFDVSPTAVDGARSRFPSSTVDYQVADILDPPQDWQASYDLVFEAYTVQVHQSPARAQAIRGIASMLSPGATLLVLAHSRAFDGEAGPPWPLTRDEVESFAVDGLSPVEIAEIADETPPGRRWLAEFRRT